MKLAKALKLKNKKVSEYKSTLENMANSNTIEKDSKKHYNSKELAELAEAQMEDLIALKTAIHNTSAPIREKIFRIGELKSYLTYINRLNTTEGIVKQGGYRSAEAPPLVYIVDFNESEKVAKTKIIQDQIDLLQEEMDAFNATTNLKGYTAE